MDAQIVKGQRRENKLTPGFDSRAEAWKMGQ